MSTHTTSGGGTKTAFFAALDVSKDVSDPEKDPALAIICRGLKTLYDAASEVPIVSMCVFVCHEQCDMVRPPRRSLCVCVCVCVCVCA
jgi:hypothetical protein